jgi:ribosomal protein L23
MPASSRNTAGIIQNLLPKNAIQRLYKESRQTNLLPPQLRHPPPFPLGSKKVYLPNIVITLKRNTKLEPRHAVFEVPLNLSKIDLRDYLWHLYNVKVLSVRSSVLPGVLRKKYKVRDQPVRTGPVRRTRAKKKMIVQLAKPFRFPRPLLTGELNTGYGFLEGSRLLMGRFQKNRYDQMHMKQRRSIKKRALGLVTNPHPMYDSVHKWS